MPPFVIPYPQFDPVLVQIGPFAIRWYALAYIFGILIGWLYARTIVRSRPLWGGKAPLTVVERRLRLRWPFTGLAGAEPVPGSIAVIAVMLGSVGLAPISYALAGLVVDVGAVPLMFGIAGAIVVGAALLGLADRFLAYALFDGTLLSLSAYLADAATLAGIALVAWRLGRARKMVSQYPWLYERAGPFAWRERTPPAP